MSGMACFQRPWCDSCVLDLHVFAALMRVEAVAVYTHCARTTWL